MATISLKVTGRTPLLQHNGQTADPLNHYSKLIKEISGKRKKTEADIKEIARLEWYAGLYVNQDMRIILPGECFEASLVGGAKKQKLGSTAKSAIFVANDPELVIDEEYDSVDKLWADEKYRFTKAAKIGTSKVMRTRPIFRKWEAVFDVEFDETQMNKSTVISIAKDAGDKVGLCDWRPRYGKFTVEEV